MKVLYRSRRKDYTICLKLHGSEAFGWVYLCHRKPEACSLPAERHGRLAENWLHELNQNGYPEFNHGKRYAFYVNDYSILRPLITLNYEQAVRKIKEYCQHRQQRRDLRAKELRAWRARRRAFTKKERCLATFGEKIIRDERDGAGDGFDPYDPNMPAFLRRQAQ